MPIPGIGKENFVKIGRINKGEAKGDKGQVGPDLDYFRVTFYDDAQQEADLFLETYGERPKEINIRLPFPDIDRVWMYQYECYKKGGMIASAGGTEETGLKWIYLRDPDTDDLIIKNGMALDIRGEDFIKEGVDIEKPIYEYKNKKGKMMPSFLEPYGRLRVIIPELLSLGFLQFTVKSIYDINSITDEMLGIDMTAGLAGKTIANIPLILFRRVDNVSVTYGGSRKRQDKSLCHIKADLAWTAATMTALTDKTYPNAPMLEEAITVEATQIDKPEPEEVVAEIVEEGEVVEKDEAPKSDVNPKEQKTTGDHNTFWQHVRKIGMSDKDAKAILAESNQDFDKAYKALLKEHTPPEKK